MNALLGVIVESWVNYRAKEKEKGKGKGGMAGEWRGGHCHSDLGIPMFWVPPCPSP